MRRSAFFLTVMIVAFVLFVAKVRADRDDGLAPPTDDQSATASP